MLLGGNIGQGYKAPTRNYLLALIGYTRARAEVLGSPVGLREDIMLTRIEVHMDIEDLVWEHVIHCNGQGVPLL